MSTNETRKEGRFTKKPVTIDAFQWDGTNTAQILFWMGTFGMPENGKRPSWITENGQFIIETLEGDHIGTVNDWVIRGVKGEFYFCKPDIFEATYSPAWEGCQHQIDNPVTEETLEKIRAISSRELPSEEKPLQFKRNQAAIQACRDEGDYCGCTDVCKYGS